MRLPPALLALCALAARTAASTYQVTEGRVQILSSTGATKYGHSFYSHADSSREAAMAIDDLDQLKFTFTLDAENHPPSQLSLAFTSSLDAVKALVVPLKLRKTGKVKYEVDLARPPVGFLPLGPDMAVHLYVSSLDASAPSPLDLSLGILRLSDSLTAKGRAQRDAERASAPAEWHVDRYAKQPEVSWTFPAEEASVPAWISGLAAGGLIIGAPWVLLLALLAGLQPRLAFDRHGLSLHSLLFLALLAGSLALALAYWTRLRLFQALPWLAGLSVVSAWVGRNALSERQARRLSSGHVKAE